LKLCGDEQIENPPTIGANAYGDADDRDDCGMIKSTHCPASKWNSCWLSKPLMSLVDKVLCVDRSRGVERESRGSIRRMILLVTGDSFLMDSITAG
jgi:hypothetical protein